MTHKTDNLEQTVFRWILILGAVSLSLLSIVMWFGDYSSLVILTVIPTLLLFWLFIAFAVREMLEKHFFGLANVLESLRNGDFSMRVVSEKKQGAWQEINSEINKLAAELQDDRLHSVEADILLDKLMAEFDIPVLVFDRHSILRNINHEGAGLFNLNRDQLIGSTPEKLHIESLIDLSSGDVIEHWFPQRGGRWELRKNFFLQEGERYTLLLLNDLSRTLREEERTAWQRLIRVLGHELNNSLASIISVSETLEQRAGDTQSDQTIERNRKALRVIGERGHSLLRFTEAYTKLAKLPKPNKAPHLLADIFERLIQLLPGSFSIISDQRPTIDVDGDQIEQLLLNLLKNAVEASSEQTEVTIDWKTYQQGILISISDMGMGISNQDNLFVPFYTTKANGSGIGLFLCRQIAEAHGGTLSLRNRTDITGCRAELWLPNT